MPACWLPAPDEESASGWPSGLPTAGNRVGLLARSKAELDLAHLEIEHAGGNALRIRADVTDFEQVNAAVDRMRVHYGEVQVLICAAAIPGPIGPFAGQSPKAWADIIHTNLLGVMNACNAVLPHMIEQRAGKIIVLSGPGATAARPNFSVYAASKAAVVRLRRNHRRGNSRAQRPDQLHGTRRHLHPHDRRDSSRRRPRRLEGNRGSAGGTPAPAA